MTTPPQRHPVVSRTPLPSRPVPSKPAPGPGADGPPPPGPAPRPGSTPPVTPAPGPASTPGPDTGPDTGAGPASTPGPEVGPHPVTPAPGLVKLDESGPGPALSDGDVVDLDTGEVNPTPGTTPAPRPASTPGPEARGPAPVKARAADGEESRNIVVDPAPADDANPAPPVDPGPTISRVGLPTAPRLSTSVDTWRPRPTPTMNLDLVDGEPSDEDEDDRQGTSLLVPAKGNKLSIQKRDIQMLKFITRYRYVTYAQLIQKFDVPYASLRRRLPKLEREGLLKSNRGRRTHVILWRVTDEGAAVAELNLEPPRKIAWSAIPHTLGLADLGIQFEAAGELVVTEIEIRAADTRNALTDRMQQVMGQGHRVLTNAPIFAVGAKAGGSSNHLHVPDMVLSRAADPNHPGIPQSIAIELELARKAPTRVRQVLSAYAKAPNIGAVAYYTPDTQVRDLIRQCAVDTNTQHLVTIYKWSPSEAMGLVTD